MTTKPRSAPVISRFLNSAVSAGAFADSPAMLAPEWSSIASPPTSYSECARPRARGCPRSHARSHACRRPIAVRRRTPDPPSRRPGRRSRGASSSLRRTPPVPVHERRIFPVRVDGAVKDALRLGAIGFDAVKHLALCRVEKRPPKLDLDVYPYLPKATIGRTSATSYMCLLGGDMGADMRGKGQGHSHALAGGEARHAATSADSPRAPSVGGWSPSAWAQARINPATSHPGGQLLCAARRSSNSRS